MFEVLVRAISLILVMVSGYLVKKIGWVKKEDFRIFSKIVLNYTLPCAIITSFNEMTIYSSMILLTFIAIAINGICAIAGILKGKKHGKKDQAFNVLNIGSFNIGAFTLPYVSSFLGPQGVVITSMFDLGNAIGAAGINYSVAKSLADGKNKVSVINIIKNMFSNVLFDVYIFMFILRLLDLKLPSAITTFTGVVGQSNTFLAMLMIGIGFEIHLDKSRIKKVISSLVVRYAIMAVIAICIYFFLPLEQQVKEVLSLVLFSPIAAMIPGFTQEIKGDVMASSFMTSLSTIISIIIMTSLLTLLY
ncbi:MAG: AEC family transporter [Clostridiales bacterium]|nr:AEC family transporter [Clostridiales bacterium]